MRENKMRLVKFELQENSSLNMNIKLIKHLIKKIKKKALGLIQSFLRKYFWNFAYLILLVKRFF